MAKRDYCRIFIDYLATGVATIESSLVFTLTNEDLTFEPQTNENPING
jgi:hypothetical protein